MTPRFSIVCIARNEAETLPRLAASLADFQARGGEIVVVDTGSTDGTPATARGLGCIVVEVGDEFAFRVNAEQAAIVGRLVPGLLSGGERVFRFDAARNFAAQVASNDCVGFIDCDEVFTTLDVERIDHEFASGADQISASYVFSHREDGTREVAYYRSTFYRKSAMLWRGSVHEALFPNAVATHSIAVGEDALLVEHRQNKKSDRSGYMAGLALDYIGDPLNARKTFYFGRELYYQKRYRAAVRELVKYLALPGAWLWEVEQATDMIKDGWRDMAVKGESLYE